MSDDGVSVHPTKLIQDIKFIITTETALTSFGGASFLTLPNHERFFVHGKF